jgi:hypothetical protein
MHFAKRFKERDEALYRLIDRDVWILELQLALFV